MEFNSVVRGDSLAQQVYNGMRRAIRDGTIRRDQFYSETEFGELMGVSRTPVREAVLALYREGLVDIVPKRGFKLVSLSNAHITEIRLLRIAIESFVVEQLCINASPNDLARLQTMLDQQAAGADTNIFELDEAFHLEMAEAAGLQETGRLLASIRGKMYLIIAGARVPPVRTGHVLSEHQKILDAIKARDSHLAKLLTADHINRSIDAFVAARNSMAPSEMLEGKKKK